MSFRIFRNSVLGVLIGVIGGCGSPDDPVAPEVIWLDSQSEDEDADPEVEDSGVSLLDTDESEEDTTETGPDTTKPEEDDATEPEEDTTEPEEDTTEPEEDTTEPEEDTTEPEEDTTEPEPDTDDPGPETTSITLEVDMSCSGIDDFSQVFVTGPWTDWCGECFILSDPDGDNVYTITLTDQVVGSTLEYKYGVDNWADQEDLLDDMNEGADCAPITDFTEYANRSLTIAPGAVTVDTYGSCESCPVIEGDPTLTLQVDMGPGYDGGVTLGNSFQGWDTAGMVQLQDPDGDGVYVGSMELPAGTVMEYKFIKGYNGGEGQWETVPASCGLVTGDYTNRVVTMPESNLVLSPVPFGGCGDDTPPSNTLCGDAPGRSTPVTINGAQILVGNTPIHMKGVAWSPVPIGAGPEGIDYAGAVELDADLMSAAGINVVRTYGPILDTTVLDTLYDHGIYVLMTVFYGYSENAETTASNVCAVKSHPAIIGWLVGNEWNYNGLGDYKPFNEAVALVGEAAQAIQDNDSTRPVSTVYGGMPSIDLLNNLSNVDFWGLNIYSGGSFGGLFWEWSNLSNKPMYLGEYGSDAFSSVINQVDEDQQADMLQSQTNEIFAQSSVNGSGPCAGGMVFEWNDEWWKSPGDGWGSQYSGAPSWTNDAYPDPGIYEEWWGLVDIYRTPRKAYTTYKNMTPPSAP